MNEILDKLESLVKQQDELIKERNKILKENNLTWSFDMCREKKCINVKGCKNTCREQGISFCCIHDKSAPFYNYVHLRDLYEMEKPKEKEPVVMTGIKYLIGGFGRHKDRMNIVVKETPKYYKLDNGDRVRKDTMETDMAVLPFQNFNYHVRVATQEEIEAFKKKVENFYNV